MEKVMDIAEARQKPGTSSEFSNPPSQSQSLILMESESVSVPQSSIFKKHLRTPPDIKILTQNISKLYISSTSTSNDQNKDNTQTNMEDAVRKYIYLYFLDFLIFYYEDELTEKKEKKQKNRDILHKTFLYLKEKISSEDGLINISVSEILHELLSCSHDLLYLYWYKNEQKIKKPNIISKLEKAVKEFNTCEDFILLFFKTNVHHEIISAQLSTHLYSLIELLVSKIENINDVINSKTSLQIAVKLHTYDIIKTLIERGANIYIKDDEGNTLAQYAAELNTYDILEFLSDKGLDVNAVNKNGDSVLHVSVICNKLDVVKSVIEYGGNILSVNKKGATVLHYAVIENTLDVIKYLVENDANVNAKDNDRRSVLHYAVIENTEEVIKYLVHEHANVHAITKDGKSVLYYAIYNIDEKVLDYLFSKEVADKLPAKEIMRILRFAFPAQNRFKKVLELNIEFKKKDTPEFIKRNVSSIEKNAGKLENSPENNFLLSLFINLIYEVVNPESMNEETINGKNIQIVINSSAAEATHYLHKKEYLSFFKIIENTTEVVENKLDDAEALDERIDKDDDVGTFSKSTLHRFDDGSIQNLKKKKKFVSIFDTSIFAGHGVHKKIRPSTCHGKEFALNSILSFLIQIHVKQLPYKISCENSKFHYFDDFVAEEKEVITCVQFKSKLGRSPLNLKLMNTKTSVDLISACFKSTISILETLEKPLPKLNLVLYINWQIDDESLKFMIQDNSVPVPFLDGLYRFSDVFLEIKSRKFCEIYNKSGSTKYEFNEVLRIFGESFYIAANQSCGMELEEKLKLLLSQITGEHTNEYRDLMLSLVKGEFREWYHPVDKENGTYLTTESLNNYFEGLKRDKIKTEHKNIFDARRPTQANLEIHPSGAERNLFHVRDFALVSTLRILLEICELPCKISCENNEFGLFNDLTVREENVTTGILFKSKVDESLLSQNELIPRKQRTRYELTKYFKSFISIIETLEKPLPIKLNLVLYINRKIDAELLNCMIEDNSVPFMDGLYRFPVEIEKEDKFDTNFLKKHSESFELSYNNSGITKYEFKDALELFGKSFFIAADQSDGTELEEKVKSLLLKFIGEESNSDCIFNIIKGQLIEWYNTDYDGVGIYLTNKSLKYYFESLPEVLKRTIMRE